MIRRAERVMEVYPEGTLAVPYTPVPVTDLDMAFPAQVDHLLPPWDDIPEDFKRGRENQWVKFQQMWFYNLLPDDVQFAPNEGVNAEAAFKHLACIQRSFQPKHQYKEAAVAYLASLWFHGVKANGTVIAGEDYSVVEDEGPGATEEGTDATDSDATPE